MSKVGKWASGLAVAATAAVGLSSLKNNEVENTQTLDEPTTANHTINHNNNKKMEAEGATFNLDADKPEIVVENQQSIGIEALANEMHRAIAHNMDYDDVMELSADDRALVVAQIAKDYRACEKSMELTGEIDPELVGENNYCSKYFDPEGDEFYQQAKVQDLQALASIVMTEEYAQHLDGLPKNGQQQQMYDKLGAEFSQLYQAHRHVSQENMNQHFHDAHNFLKDEIGDISHLTGEEEIAQAQERIEEAKEAYLESVTSNLDSEGIDDIAYVQQKEAAKDAMEFMGDVERYQEYYETDIEEAFKTQSLEQEYDDKVDFARSIRLVAEKYGVNDQITMQYDTENHTLNIDPQNLDDEFEL